jgi:hypothetical protein
MVANNSIKFDLNITDGNEILEGLMFSNIAYIVIS